MTWTYPADSGPMDLVRLKIGDTSSSDPQLMDEEIQSLLDTQPVLYAAAAAARAIAAKYTRAVNRSIGRLKIDTASRAKAYLTLADQLEREAHITALPLTGGVSITEKREPYFDRDVVEPFFTRELHEPGSQTPAIEPTTIITV